MVNHRFVTVAAALVAAALSVSPVADAERVCTRTFKGREHLHPRVHTLPALTAAQTLELSTFPKQLDWCDEGLCTASWNQHIPQYCGSCFAHAALSAAQDRIKIAHRKQGYTGPEVVLGRQSFLNCAPAHGLSDGCGGGEPADVYEFMHRFGLPHESCLPYSATDHTKYTATNGTCPPEGYCMNCMHHREAPDAEPTCFPVERVVRYRAKSYGRVAGEHAMMKALLNGPLACGIACSDGFTYDYRAGVFEDTTGFMDIDHDVEIVGFGEENGKKYWHVRNSWGTYWGMNGFFKIVRGVNNLGIESDCHFVDVDLSDEALVASDSAPLYGGSHLGLVPFAAASADVDETEQTKVIATTVDVAFSSNPLTPNELVDSDESESDSESDVEVVAAATKLRATAMATAVNDSGSVSTPVLVAMCTSLGVAIGVAVARVARRNAATYAPIN